MDPGILSLIAVVAWPVVTVIVPILGLILVSHLALRLQDRYLSYKEVVKSNERTNGTASADCSGQNIQEKTSSLQDREVISAERIYSEIIANIIHAESITWERFYSFLMASSILVLAWAALYKPNSGPSLILFTISVFGSLMSLSWAALGYRGRRYHQLYVKLACRMEKPDRWPLGLEEYRMLTRSRRLRKELPFFFGGSRFLLVSIPLAFLILYLALAVVSLRP